MPDHRNLNNAELDEYDNFERSDGLSCRIAYGTYKMFAVEGESGNIKGWEE